MKRVSGVHLVLAGMEADVADVHICMACGWTVEGEAPDRCVLYGVKGDKLRKSKRVCRHTGAEGLAGPIQMVPPKGVCVDPRSAAR